MAPLKVPPYEVPIPNNRWESNTRYMIGGRCVTWLLDLAMSGRTVNALGCWPMFEPKLNTNIKKPSCNYRDVSVLHE